MKSDAAAEWCPGTGEHVLDRIKLVKNILKESITTAATVNNFLEKPRKYASDDSLYMREVHFVVALGPKELPTMGEMAESLNVTPGAVTQMVTRLEKKGYVLRSKSTKDKRQTTIALTEKGRQLWRSHLDYDHQKHMNASERLAEFSDDELEKIIRFERILRDLFIKEE